ncbi:MAG: hypothetical protein PHR96_00060 [Clostridia bacterium]|jgi:hypothetical protein|nr:hypothetical protein [Clostridia bacterium]
MKKDNISQTDICLPNELQEKETQENTPELTINTTDQKKESFIKFLTSLYQNACTAMQSIEDLQPKVECENLKKELSNQLTNYDIIARECEMIAKSENIDLKDNNIIEKIKLWGSIKMSTLADKSTRHITELMLMGTVFGLIQNLKDAVDYKNICPELDDLCQKLTELEETNYQTLKNFI